MVDLLNLPLPIDLPSHADTMKFTEKIEPFDPTGERITMQLKWRRYVSSVALRSPAILDIRDYGHAAFALSALEGPKKAALRGHIATILLMSTRGSASDLLMSANDHRRGRPNAVLLLVEEYGGKHDGAVAMAAQDTIAFDVHTGNWSLKVD